MNTRSTKGSEHKTQRYGDTEKLAAVGICRKCCRVWIPFRDGDPCPEGPHGRPVQGPLLCRACDRFVSLNEVPDHMRRHRNWPWTEAIVDGDERLPTP